MCFPSSLLLHTASEIPRTIGVAGVAGVAGGLVTDSTRIFLGDLTVIGSRSCFIQRGST